MKKIFLYFLLSLSFIGPSYADFQDGVDAYNNKQYKKALKEFKPLAEKGNAYAQYYLGHFYLQGLGVWPNVDKSFYWYEKAAKQGETLSQYAMGLFYAEGESVAQNDIKALEWFKKAANQGGALGEEANKEIVAIESRLGITSSESSSDVVNFDSQSVPANAYGTVNNWWCKTGYKKTGNNCICINVPNNAYAFGDSWKCKTGYEYEIFSNSCIKPTTAGFEAVYQAAREQVYGGQPKVLPLTDDEFEAECQAQQARLADGQPKVLPLTDDEFEAEYQAQQATLAEHQQLAEGGRYVIPKSKGNFLTTSIPTKEILLINTANLSGQEQYKTTSLENLSCKSYIVVTKGGGINVKQVESSTYQKSSKYLQGYTDVTNQRYFELQSRIRQARYELEDVYAGDASGYNNWTALLAGVLTGVRENQVKDKIRALEKELRNTSMTTRKKNIATYNVTGKTVSFEKTQRFKWMSINCINGEVSINEVTDKENSGKTHFFTGIHAEDLGGLSVNTEKSKQNRIKIWSDRPLLSMSDIEGNKSSVLTTSTINTDNISIVSKIKWFLSTQ